MCSSFQRLSQKKSRAVQLRLAPTNCDSENSRYLFVLVAFDVVQDENPPRPGWQLSYRLLEIHAFGMHWNPRHLVPLLFIVLTIVHPRGVLSVRLPCIQND